MSEAVTPATQPNADKPKEDTKVKVIAEIKKQPVAEQIKLIGLFKLYHEIKAADEVYEKDFAKASYNAHLKTKALFGQAIQIYKNEFAFSKAAIKDPSVFFTEEELADPDFEKLEASPATNPWCTLLTKIDLINTYITETDEEILKHLTGIDVCRNPDNDNFTAEFTFAKNEYFSNESLKLEVTVDESEDDGMPITHIKSTEVNWFPGKDPRHEEKTTKAKTKKGKKIPGKVKLERIESFFWLFKEHFKSEEDMESDDEDGEGGNPLSDDGLYQQAADMLEIVRKHMYTYAIPALFGIKVEEFAGLGDFDEEGMEGLKTQIEKGEKPECKQQ